MTDSWDIYCFPRGRRETGGSHVLPVTTTNTSIQPIWLWRSDTLSVPWVIILSRPKKITVHITEKTAPPFHGRFIASQGATTYGSLLCLCSILWQDRVPQPRERITAPCHKMGVWNCMEGTLELLLFSNNKNEAILIMRMKPKEKEKKRNHHGLVPRIPWHHHEDKRRDAEGR